MKGYYEARKRYFTDMGGNAYQPYLFFCYETNRWRYSNGWHGHEKKARGFRYFWFRELNCAQRKKYLAGKPLRNRKNVSSLEKTFETTQYGRMVSRF